MSPDVPEPDFDKPSPEPANALGEPAANAGDAAGVAAQVRAQAQRQRSSTEFWASIFVTPEGRREMWTILNELNTFGLLSGSSPNGSFDPVVASYSRGRQDAGQQMFLSWLGHDRDGVVQMLAEHQPRVLEVSKTAATVKPRRTRKKNPTA